MGSEALQKKFKDEVSVYKKLQRDYTKITGLRSHLDSQLNENTTVKEELDLLGNDGTVYKMIGPALIKQDLEEAKQNVNKRIDYITQEINRHDETIQNLDKEQDNKKECLGKLQQQLQQLMVKAAATQK